MQQIISRVPEKQRNSFWLGGQARGENDKCQPSLLGSQRGDSPGQDGTSAGPAGVLHVTFQALTGQLGVIQSDAVL